VSEIIQSKAIAGKVARVMTTVRKLRKDGSNEYDHYKYISADSAFEIVGGAMAEVGLVALPSIVELTTEAMSSATGKSQFRTVVHGLITLADADTGDTWSGDWYGEGVDRADKSINKAMTAMMKYYLLRLFQIGSGEDADADSPEIEERQTQSAKFQAQHRQPSPRAVTPPQPTAKPVSDDVDFGMGGEEWDNLPNRAASDDAFCDRAAALMHSETQISDLAVKLITKVTQLDQGSGDKTLSIVKKDGTGSGQYGLLTGKIDALVGKNNHRFVLSALCGRVIRQENPPGWKTKDLIDWLNGEEKAKSATEQAIRDVWSAVQQVEQAPA